MIEQLRIEIFDQKTSLTTLQILKEMMRWQALLQMKSVKERFKQEREQIIADLIQNCQKNKETFDQRTLLFQENQVQDKYASTLIHKINLCRQFLGKTKRIQNTA